MFVLRRRCRMAKLSAFSGPGTHGLQSGREAGAVTRTGGDGSCDRRELPGVTPASSRAAGRDGPCSEGHSSPVRGVLALPRNRAGLGSALAPHSAACHAPPHRHQPPASDGSPLSPHCPAPPPHATYYPIHPVTSRTPQAASHAMDYPHIPL